MEMDEFQVGFSRRLLIFIFLCALGGGFLGGFFLGTYVGPGGGGFAAQINIEGSNTLFELQSTWAYYYMQDNPGVNIIVGGAGTSVGISQLINGIVDIAGASRLPKSSEYALANSRGVDLHVIPVCIDGIVIIVHPSNPISNISLPILRGIYNGSITEWGQVNSTLSGLGNIIVYSRDPSSGTYSYFQEYVMENDDYTSSAQPLAGNSAIIYAVAADIRGIGYVGAAYAQTSSVKVIPVNDPVSGIPIEPNPENIKDFTYPIARYLYMVTNGIPRGYIAAYIDWCLGPQGQVVAETTGYMPVYSLPV
ncbi:MAG: PstS family phosphate ABC transporter substrate-binding protein [Candidatus Odinarchaeota archaeon]